MSLSKSMTFQKKYDLETRIKESTRIKEKYPNKLPVIVEQHKSSTIKKIDSS